MKQVGGPDEPLRLTNTSTQEISPAWSPDGRHLAYLEVQPSGQAKLMLIPVLGGQSPRELST
ncbi:MAG: PD40 domain-containing protein, partial [Sphingopyxis sp.]|nr:PD40 domain-containing protein [Sphingopyxis sp.]